MLTQQPQDPVLAGADAFLPEPRPDLAIPTLAARKRFLLPKEGHAIEFRGEFYDLLNRPNFSNPIANLVSPAFGRITRAGGSRVLQLALRYDF